MNKRKIIMISVGAVLAVLILSFVTAQVLAMSYNSQLSDYIAKHEAEYEKSEASYAKEETAISNGITKITNDKSKPSYGEKMEEQGKLFAKYETAVRTITAADKKYVEGLSQDIPTVVKLPLLGYINPSYKQALADQQRVDELLQDMQRGLVAEQFFSAKHPQYFKDVERMQSLIEYEALGKLARAFGAAKPGQSKEEYERSDKLKEYKDATRLVPAYINLVETTTLPDDAYFEDARQQALSDLAESDRMYTLYYDGLNKNDDSLTKQADAIAARDDGKLLKYKVISSDALILPLSNLSTIEQSSKELFSLQS